MNLWEKLQKIKLDLLHSNLKKTGKNTFAKYTYYELADFLPTIVKLCNENKVYTQISFTNDTAILTAINAEKTDEIVTIESPMRDLELKGCNAIQALGGVETYQRRYLYSSLFDIVENDMFDGAEPQQTNSKPQPQIKAEKEYKCLDCGKPFTSFTDKDGKTWNAGQCYHMAESKYDDKKARCFNCGKKYLAEKGDK